VLGTGCNKHCGNLKFRQFIKAYKRARLQSKTKIEPVHAAEVVHFWRKLTPPGRFLAKAKNSPDGQWSEVNDKQAIRIASFFLCNQHGDELKRQKSTDAIKNSRNFQEAQHQQLRMSGNGNGQDYFGQGNGNGMGNQVAQGQAQYQGMGIFSCQGEGQDPDFMSSLEPMPIGQVGSSSSTSNTWDCGQPQQIQSCPEPVKASFNDLEQDIDFNPLPFKPNNNCNNDEYGFDDFEPLPTSFHDPFPSCNNQSMYSRSPVDLSTNAQFGGPAEQVQVSVNMVVNTMPQGYARDNTVNTVTNIQIGTGTISDDRKPNDGFLKSSFGDVFQGSNFQLTTDTTNGFIQISAQSNPKDGSANMVGPGMMNPGNTLPSFNNFGGMGGGGQYVGNGNVSQGATLGNAFERRSINLSINNVNASRDNSGDQKSSLAWNKMEVANSVPDAASLVGSLFDDW
jgi:hypothetical protein